MSARYTPVADTMRRLRQHYAASVTREMRERPTVTPRSDLNARSPRDLRYWTGQTRAGLKSAWMYCP